MPAARTSNVWKCISIRGDFDVQRARIRQRSDAKGLVGDERDKEDLDDPRSSKVERHPDRDACSGHVTSAPRIIAFRINFMPGPAGR